MKPLFLALLFAAPANAECAISTDLPSGIVVTREGLPTTTVFSFQGSIGSNSVRHYIADSPSGSVGIATVELTSTNWLWLYKSSEVVDVSLDLTSIIQVDDYGYQRTTRYSYTSDLIIPGAGAETSSEWTVSMTATTSTVTGSSGGIDEMSETYEVRYIAEKSRKVSFGDCSYNVKDVAARYLGGGRDWTEHYVYIPELGFAVETETTDARSGKLGPHAILSIRPAR